MNNQIHFFKSRFFTILLICVLTASCTSQKLNKNGDQVYIKTTGTEMYEDVKPSPVTIVIGRNQGTAPVQVQLHVEGDAKPGTDYLVEGTVLEDDNSFKVTLAEGQSSVEIMVTVIDDVSAETEESLQLKLNASDQYTIDRKNRGVEINIPRNDFVVTSISDAGEGSLRQAMLNANAIEGLDEIRFDSEHGPFGPPQEIKIESTLPVITDDLTIDGYISRFLWQRAGVIIDGGEKHRIFSVADGVNAAIKNLTLTDGKARSGGGILNRGNLVVSGTTFMNNSASNSGGAIANLKGNLWVINSTLANNRARKEGGAIVNQSGTMTVTNSTFSENTAKNGGAVFNDGSLLINNSILANSYSDNDCVSLGISDPASTHNIIEVNEGCPGVLYSEDPRLGPMKYYNGMTQTIPLLGKSLAIHAGDNASAIDENGEPLRWDQRGNGDPRFVAGFTDIGAFETQAFPTLVVDTLNDDNQQACGGGRGDCPLRAAIRLAEVNGKPDTITFDPRVFTEPKVLILNKPLPVPSTAMVIDASDVPNITIHLNEPGQVFETAIPNTFEIRGLEITEKPPH